MKAIIGLGNPGGRYRGTRHNIGFAVIDELARRWNVGRFQAWNQKAEYAVWRPAAGEQVLLARPLTFMNESGQAVGELVRYFKVDPAELLIVVDEAQLPLGRLRARPRGSAGGHNGLKSVIMHLGESFSRLRVGIGRGPEGESRRDLADHVLSWFEPHEQAEVARVTAKAAEAAETFIASGIEQTMNRFNAPDDPTANEEGLERLQR